MKKKKPAKKNQKKNKCEKKNQKGRQNVFKKKKIKKKIKKKKEKKSPDILWSDICICIPVHHLLSVLLLCMHLICSNITYNKSDGTGIDISCYG